VFGEPKTLDDLKLRTTLGGPDGTCWEWQAAKIKGYGVVSVGGRKHRAHRGALEMHSGPIPDGLWALHRCHNRPCINPDHLYAGTVLDNNRDTDAAGHKPRGESASWAKLTEGDVAAIRASDDTNAALARRYGVTPTAIFKVRNNLSWRPN
jgi:hypothetical protein